MSINLILSYIDFVTQIIPYVKHIKNWFRKKGSYEILLYDVELNILDEHGKQAQYSKSQRIRILQNGVFAYLDTLWGDGSIFKNYRTSYGYPVDMYQEGHRHRVLISFREMKNKGDEQDIYIEREIVDGFTQEFEALQTDIYYPTRELNVKIIFPAGRTPKQIRLIEHNHSKGYILPDKHFRELVDGRIEVIWRIDYPRLHNSYTLRWEW